MVIPQSRKNWYQIGFSAETHQLIENDTEPLNFECDSDALRRNKENGIHKYAFWLIELYPYKFREL